MGREVLFSAESVSDWAQARFQRAVEGTNSIPADRVLAVPEADLLEELVKRYRVEPHPAGEGDEA